MMSGTAVDPRTPWAVSAAAEQVPRPQPCPLLQYQYAFMHSWYASAGV